MAPLDEHAEKASAFPSAAGNHFEAAPAVSQASESGEPSQANSETEPGSSVAPTQSELTEEASVITVAGSQAGDTANTAAGGASAVPPSSHRRSSGGLPRMLAVLLALAAAAGVIWLLRTLSWLVAPVFFGLTMVVAVYPVFTGLVKRKVPRWLAATTMALVLVGLLAAGIYAVVWAVGAIVNAAPNYVPAVVTAWNSLLAWLVKLGVNSTTLNSLVTNFDPTRLLGAAGSLVTSLSGIIGMVTVVLASVLMMMIDTVGWDGRLGMAAQTHPRMVTALRGFASGVRQYWIVSSIFGAIMAGLNGLELLLLHVPLIGVWMLLTFVTTFIPNVGFFFAMIPAVLMALAATSWRNALLLMALYFITTWIVQGIFQPKYAGNAIGVNTTVSFLSFLLWAWVFGPLGALIALPLTQFVKSLLVDADPRARWLNALIAQPPNAEGAEQED